MYLLSSKRLCLSQTDFPSPETPTFRDSEYVACGIYQAQNTAERQPIGRARDVVDGSELGSRVDVIEKGC